jgi:hypothetical protein
MNDSPGRSMLELKIDDAQLRMLSAETPESRQLWGQRFTALIRERNALRSPAEIERIEREKGIYTDKR